VVGVFFKGRENLLRKEHGVYFDEYERVLRKIPLSRPLAFSSILLLTPRVTQTMVPIEVF
jgi:hypothetical protein